MKKNKRFLNMLLLICGVGFGGKLWARPPVDLVSPTSRPSTPRERDLSFSEKAEYLLMAENHFLFENADVKSGRKRLRRGEKLRFIQHSSDQAWAQVEHQDLGLGWVPTGMLRRQQSR